MDDPAAQTALVVTAFAVVYLGTILGGLPRLHLDRTGVALLGAIAIVGGGVTTPQEAAQAVHLPTILLLLPACAGGSTRCRTCSRSRARPTSARRRR